MQACAAFQTNPPAQNFVKGTIYTGPAKSIVLDLIAVPVQRPRRLPPLEHFRRSVGSSLNSVSRITSRGTLILIGTLLG